MSTIKVKHRMLAPIILLILFICSSFIVEASETETIMPIADTFVNVLAINSTYGERDYLEVSEYASGLSIAFLMFDISHVLNVPSEVKLRLYCFNVTSPHIVGVHWCVNNTWKEENLTFASFGGFFKTDPEDAVRVDFINWYEWKVTNFVSKAMEENYEKITLTLEVEDKLEGRSRYASKDQPTQEMREYSPQLVFTYLQTGADSLDPIVIVASVFTVIAAIVLIAYKFSKRTTQKPPRRKARPK